MRTGATFRGLFISEQINHLKLIVEEQEISVTFVEDSLHQIGRLLVRNALSLYQSLIFLILHGLRVIGHVDLLFRRNLVHYGLVATNQDVISI